MDQNLLRNLKIKIEIYINEYILSMLDSFLSDIIS